MAFLAFRHADQDLADTVYRTFQQALDLFRNAADVVANYAQVAQRVGQTILPDLRLAVEEQQPNLAVSLLGLVMTWVSDMRSEGEGMQLRYVQLQESMLDIVRRAQLTKTNADRRLAEAVRELRAEQPSVTQAVAAATQPAQATGAQLKAFGVCGSAGHFARTGVGADGLPVSLSGLSSQLFEKLSRLETERDKGGGGDSAGALPLLGSPGKSDEGWQRDVLDLLFMAPGVAPASLPKLEVINVAAKIGQDEDFQAAAEESDGMIVEDDDGSAAGEVADDAGDGAEATSSSGGAVVPYVKQAQNASSRLGSAAKSSASLLRALRELRRVDTILKGCSSFWDHMGSTVQKLAQMKEHTERLVSYASGSEQLRKRFEQRLVEYTNFWASLERLCRQYALDHQAAVGRMQSFLREVRDAADLIDTVESAKVGLEL